MIAGRVMSREVFSSRKECLGEMEKELYGKNRPPFLDAYESMMGPILDRTPERLVMGAFLGMKYLEWAKESGTECVNGIDMEVETEWDLLNEWKAKKTLSEDVWRNGGGKKEPVDVKQTESLGTSDREECQALADLYDATNGREWTDQTGWTDRTALLTDCCSLMAKGIKCIDGHVIEIVLSENGLQGHVPSSIGKLTFLKKLCVISWGGL
jgi:hypothetical protein